MGVSPCPSQLLWKLRLDRFFPSLARRTSHTWLEGFPAMLSSMASGNDWKALPVLAAQSRTWSLSLSSQHCNSAKRDRVDSDQEKKSAMIPTASNPEITGSPKKLAYMVWFKTRLVWYKGDLWSKSEVKKLHQNPVFQITSPSSVLPFNSEFTLSSLSAFCSTFRVTNPENLWQWTKGSTPSLPNSPCHFWSHCQVTFVKSKFSWHRPMTAPMHPIPTPRNQKTSNI